VAPADDKRPFRIEQHARHPGEDAGAAERQHAARVQDAGVAE
jgi:hypothetical protein